jgi:Uma2 family endonuclease
MIKSVLIEEQIEIPFGLQSLDEFRVWATSPSFPERGRIDFLGGRIEVDMSPEDLYTHGKVKTELVVVLGQRIKRLDLGDLYTDSTRATCPKADLSSEPDIVFVSHRAIDTGRVRLVPKSGEPDRYVELEGAPDLIVEIVSDTSVAKDTERLPREYFQGGVPEFWLVDARGETLLFHVFRRGRSQYRRAPADAERYHRSRVFDCWFRLDRRRGARGRVAFDLREKESSR